MKANNRTAVRLGSFALVLAGTFGTAYAIGERLPGHDHSTSSAGHDQATHGQATHDHATDGADDSPIAPGFAMNGYQLVTETVNEMGVTFHLRGPDGDNVTEFAVVHGALLHAVVIRPDLSDFHHLHPSIDTDGSWTLPIDGPGQWHIVFEATPVVDGAPLTQSIIVSANSDDESATKVVPLPAAADTVEVGGLLVTRDGFEFRVTNADGSAATDLEPYLEQAAHLVALRQGDLAFKHLHPSDSPAGTFDFGNGLRESGRYRLFLQFGYAGEVVTVPFTVELP